MNNPKLDRKLFESAISPIIRGSPSKLLQYGSKKLGAFMDCDSCQTRFLVREKGLTKENLAIYLRMFRIMGGARCGKCCFGIDKKEISLCYDFGSLSLVFDIHVNVFSRIANIGFSVGKCRGSKQTFLRLVSRRDQGDVAMWNELTQGILAMKNSYQRSGFEASKDILVARDLNSKTVIALHGHQLRGFHKGKRPEQKISTNMRLDEPDFVALGHYHKLGVFKIPHFKGVVCMGGSRIFGPYLSLGEYYPEILSEMGSVSWHWDDDYRLRLEIERTKIDIDKFREIFETNRRRPASIQRRVDAVRGDFRLGLKIILPGNHDPIDEAYAHESLIRKIPKSGPIPLDSMGYGDYIEFRKSEADRVEKEFKEMLAEEGFVPLAMIRKRSSP